MAGMDILNNGLRSATGGVTKAFIQFEDERIKAKDIKVSEVRARSGGLSSKFPGGEKINNTVKKMSEKSQKMANSISGLMTGVGKDLMSTGNVYVVKFNPSEMNFQAYGGMKVQRMNYGAGDDNQIKAEFVEMKPRIMLNIPLVFDDLDRADAFMMEKFNSTSSGMNAAITGVASSLTGKQRSVRPQVEGFIAAVRNEKTRKMTFYWGNMIYKGVLENVSAEYTMFNMQGNPIRANVNLGLLLIDESIGDNNMGYWANSYEKLFAEDSSSLGSAVQNVGNLVNLKL